MLFKVISKMERDPSKKILGEFTDLEIDNMHLDTRLYNIIPLHTYEKMVGIQPHSFLHVFVNGDEDGSFKKTLFPVFSQADLSNVYLTASGHLACKSCLSDHQKLWLEENKENGWLFEGDDTLANVDGPNADSL